MLGDAAYDSAELREQLDERGTKPVIPNRCNRKQPFTFNKRLYKLRWRIEAAFNRLKDFRRIATRYDRLARNYLASLPRRRSCMVGLISLGPSSVVYAGLSAKAIRPRLVKTERARLAGGPFAFRKAKGIRNPTSVSERRSGTR